MSENYTFRRSRTITGSAASGVGAASEHKGQLRSTRLQEHDLRAHRRKLLAYLLACISFMALLGYIVTQFIGSISSVRVTSPGVQPSSSQTDRYRRSAQTYLESQPLQRFFFSLSQDQLAQRLVSQSPEIASARLEQAEGLGEGELVLSLRTPVVAWTIQGKKYYVDSEGVAFTSNSLTEPTIGVIDKSGTTAAAGVVTSAKLLHFIGRLVTLINASGVAVVDAVELPENSTREVDIRLKDKPYLIKTHSDRDPAGQAADVVSAVRFVSQFELAPQYLDVRVSSKAFYRE